MEYEIKQVEKRIIAGFHMVGPWEQTVKQGFEQLMMWVDGKQIVPLEWIAVYYDNPDVVPAEKLRCDTVAGGDYAIAVARVENHDFATPWYQFFERLLQDSTYAIAAKPCFEVYMNNGMEDGYWDIEMYVPVQSK